MSYALQLALHTLIYTCTVRPFAGGSNRAFAVRGVVLCALLFLARAKNPATAQLGKWVMTGLMIEMVRSPCFTTRPHWSQLRPPSGRSVLFKA